MAVIYLVHDIHGAKVAIAEEEAIYDEMHGWRRYDPNTPDAADNSMAANPRRPRRRAPQEE